MGRYKTKPRKTFVGAFGSAFSSVHRTTYTSRANRQTHPDFFNGLNFTPSKRSRFILNYYRRRKQRRQAAQRIQRAVRRSYIGQRLEYYRNARARGVNRIYP